MADTTPDNKTCNTDVHSYVRRANRAIQELTKSQSSGVSGTSTFDVIRAKSYLAGLRSLLAFITSEPLMDLPETGPTALDLPDRVVIPPMENDSTYDLCVLLKLSVDEISNCQSSRNASGLIIHDYKRITPILDRADSFIRGFMMVIDPLDNPETSPSTPSTGPGLRGGT